MRARAAGRKESAAEFSSEIYGSPGIIYLRAVYHLTRGFTNTMGASLFLIKLKIKSRAQARALSRTLSRARPRVPTISLFFSLFLSLVHSSRAIFRRICNLYLCIGDSFARFKLDGEGFFLFGRFNYSNTA